MCGIAALISRQDIPRRTLMDMAAIIAHRGPDGWGCAVGDSTAVHTWSAQDPDAGGSGRIGLAHRRLSILDLSPLGHQPMASADGSLWIVYNGEVYNHDELRRELEGLGHRFRSRCDTEVVLAAYAQWGEDFLSRCNGMWGMAIWDRPRQRLFLARDRFGVKPLYYWISPDGDLAIASEIKQFTVLPGWRAQVEPQAAYDFLAWGVTDHQDGTFFAGVRQLPPGCCATIKLADWRGLPSGGRLPWRRWYTPAAAPAAADLAGGVEALRSVLTDAVRMRLRADVPVGSCLSGGLDSSSIVCLAQRLLTASGGGSQHTVSAVSEDPQIDESQWMDLVAAHTAVRSHRVRPQRERLFAELPEVVWHQDEPFGSTSIYAQWCVFRLAREQGITVMLDGQGADEQLAGYHPVFLPPHLAALVATGRWCEAAREAAAIRRRLGYGRAWLLQRTLACLLPARLREYARRQRGAVHATPAWLDLDRLGARPRDPFADLGMRSTDLGAVCRAQLTGANLQMLLRWEDRNSMAFGVEARVPFLDYRLVELTLGMPATWKIHRGETKRALRLAMDGTIPDAIRDRHDKIGFATAEERWLRHDASDAFRAGARSSIDICGGILGQAALDLVEATIAGKRPFDFIPWRIIVFGAWMQRFGVRAG